MHYYDDETMRCIDCDCRPGGKWSVLPCGIIDQIPNGYELQNDWPAFLEAVAALTK